MYLGDIHIGHHQDAINLINELLDDDQITSCPDPFWEKLEDSLEALKDALERSII